VSLLLLLDYNSNYYYCHNVCRCNDDELSWLKAAALSRELSLSAAESELLLQQKQQQRQQQQQLPTKTSQQASRLRQLNRTFQLNITPSSPLSSSSSSTTASSSTANIMPMSPVSSSSSSSKNSCCGSSVFVAV